MIPLAIALLAGVFPNVASHTCDSGTCEDDVSMLQVHTDTLLQGRTTGVALKEESSDVMLDIAEIKEMAILATALYWKTANQNRILCKANPGMYSCCDKAPTTKDEDVMFKCGSWTMTQGDILSVKSGLVFGKDQMGIFKNGRKCAVAFAGSDDGHDGVQDLYTVPTEACGYSKVHKGFAGELAQFKNAPKWSSFMQTLSNDCDTVYSTGHSLGGAVASLFAACSNRTASSWTGSPEVHKLYTFGAPGITYGEPLEKASGGCFGGGRFFSKNVCDGVGSMTWLNREWCKAQSVVDFAPWIFSSKKLQHPKVAAITLEKGWREDGILKVLKAFPRTSISQDPQFECDSEDAAFAPPPETPWAIRLHNMGNYIGRTQDLES